MRFPVERYRQFEDRIEVEETVYATIDGRDLHLEIVRPAATDDRIAPLPVVFWVHGGGWGWRGNYGGHRETMQLPMAAAGFCAIGIEYRLSVDASFPAQILDITRAVTFVRDRADELGIDPRRIGVWGRSAGGHLAALLGCSCGAGEFGGPVELRAVVSCFGPSDLSVITRDLDPEREEHIRKIARPFLGGEIEERSDLVELANPVAHLYRAPERTEESVMPAFLFVHGERDRSVPISQSTILHEALISRGHRSSFLGVRGAGHGLLPDDPEVAVEPGLEEIHRRIQAFFELELRR